MIDPVTAHYTPSPEQITLWEGKTGAPFDPFEHKKVATTYMVSCPFCGAQNDVLWEDELKGYAEPKFSKDCGLCFETITHEKLRAAKFFTELHAVAKSENAIFS